MPSIASVIGLPEALKTTTTPSSDASTSAPTVSSMRITIRPAVASAPALGNVTFSRIRSASPSVNSGEEVRRRSRSRVASLLCAISAGVGVLDGSSSIGTMRSQASPFFSSPGRPLAYPFVSPVQSIAL